ncbi:MAG: VOC family protein [Parasphingorhabdus sp.]|uniref:VOC family protein n=1 Tax=Parasphingorhabdus sp. TaxID=2709688 RepID=UPI0032970826
MKFLAPFLIAGLLLTAPAQAQNSDAPQQEAATLGLNHIGFAVTKLDDTVAFFVDILGWKPAGGRPEYPAKFVTNGKMFVTLWQVTDPAKAVAFDRKQNVGLHHMAITVRDLPTLHDLHRKFVAHKDVTVEFAPEFLGDGPTTHMIIREPSGLRLEFIVPADRVKPKG